MSLRVKSTQNKAVSDGLGTAPDGTSVQKRIKHCRLGADITSSVPDDAACVPDGTGLVPDGTTAQCDGTRKCTLVPDGTGCVPDGTIYAAGRKFFLFDVLLISRIILFLYR